MRWPVENYTRKNSQKKKKKNERIWKGWTDRQHRPWPSAHAVAESDLMPRNRTGKPVAVTAIGGGGAVDGTPTGANRMRGRASVEVFAGG